MRILVIGMIAVLATGAALTASATTYRQADPVARTPPTVAPMQEQVLTGEVRTTTSEWHGQKIVTRITVDVADSSPVEFLVAGGSVDGIAMRVTGAPKFMPGQRVRVTVRTTQSGFRLVGLATRTEVLP